MEMLFSQNFQEEIKLIFTQPSMHAFGLWHSSNSLVHLNLAVNDLSGRTIYQCTQVYDIYFWQIFFLCRKKNYWIIRHSLLHPQSICAIMLQHTAFCKLWGKWCRVDGYKFVFDCFTTHFSKLSCSVWAWFLTTIFPAEVTLKRFRISRKRSYMKFWTVHAFSPLYWHFKMAYLEWVSIDGFTPLSSGIGVPTLHNEVWHHSVENGVVVVSLHA